ncbi:hypothetical protein [Nocardia gipuzkoensis]|nr:hypothetical protein [Nocardia gipuzkoensis]
MTSTEVDVDSSESDPEPVAVPSEYGDQYTLPILEPSIRGEG